MIISAYITPHSPILVPNIGKQNTSILEKTISALSDIKKEIAKQDIDTLIVISPHNNEKNQEVILNDHFEALVNLEEFGDYSNKIILESDMSQAYKLKEAVEDEYTVELEAKHRPDHGANIPLYLLLTENNQKIKEFKGKVLIINTTIQKDLNYHFELGKKLATELSSNEKRFAIIASGELSHCLTRNAPGGFFQKANLFDDKTIENLKKGKEGLENILNTDKKLAQEAKECGLRPIALMLGMIDNLPYTPETLAYQKDLGVGYLTMKHYGRY